MEPLLTEAHRALLLANGRRQQPLRGTGREIDFEPVVMLFNAYSTAGRWLLTELEPDDPDIAFGLCDLGMGFPELGYVSLNELASLSVWVDCRIARNDAFVAKRTLSAYAAEARRTGCIDTRW
jgi:hypothetical protein